jgi:hypothetical protein
MYRIVGSDQNQYGPATVAQIHEWLRDGRANGQSLVFQEGWAEWKPLASIPELAAGLKMASIPPLTSATQAPGPLPDVPNYLTPAIIITICTCCCCNPIAFAFAVVAIVFAMQVSPKLSAGDYEGAQKSSKDAKLWCILAVVVFTILLIGGVIFQTMFFLRDGFKFPF